MVKAIIFFFFVFSVSLQSFAADDPRVTLFFEKMSVKLCSEGEPFRDCYSTAEVECVRQVRADLKTCGEEVGLDTAGKNEVFSKMRVVGNCAAKKFAAANKSVFRPTSACMKRIVASEKPDDKPKSDIEMFEARAAKAASQGGLSAEYMKALITDVEGVNSFKEKFKNDAKSFCPGYKGQDQSTCVQSYLRTLKIKSSSEAVLYLTVVVGLTLEDKKLGFSKEMLSLFMIENSLLLVGNLNLAEFRLAKLKPAYPNEHVELKMLKADDEKMLEGFHTKIANMLEKKLLETEAGRKPASLSQWEQDKIKEVKLRLTEFKKLKWTYPL